MPQIPISHPPVSAVSVVPSLDAVVPIVEFVPLSAVPGPTLVSATVAEDDPALELPDGLPLLLVSVGEKHAAARLAPSPSHLMLAARARPLGLPADARAPSGPPRSTSVIRMLPNA